ncbi:MAG: TIGR04133 family radical SAM/SPASM protein [Bacteroidota bacterium]
MKPGLKKQILLNTFRQHRHNQAQLHPLKYLFWESTLRCNLKCRHCGSDCRVSSSVPDMPLEDFLRVLDEITPMVNPHETIIVVTGGEPLLRKDLEVAGMEFIKRGFPWGMVSNGLALTEQRFRSLLDHGLHSITISLDGMEKQHNRLRMHPSSWSKAVAAIKMIAGTKDLTYDVVTCVHRENIGELNEMKQLLARMGVNAWRLFTIFPKGRAADEDWMNLSPGEFRQLLQFISETRKEGVIRASYGCEGYLGEFEMEVRDHPFFCQAGITIGSVLADGSISACPSIRDSFNQGNIYRDSFAATWETGFRDMRDRSWARTGLCADCGVWKWCEGNGLHLRDKEDAGPLLCHYELLKNS